MQAEEEAKASSRRTASAKRQSRAGTAGDTSGAPGSQPPDRKAERLSVVDAVRAAALFGVLVMNWHTMSCLEYMSTEQLAAIQDSLDRIVEVCLQILVDKKSLSAFSFLFGLSFWLILERSQDRDFFLPMFTRRMAMLAIFGGINFIFLFWGDILITYAVFGMFLPLAARLPQRVVLIISGLLLLGFPLALSVLGFSEKPDGQTSSDLQALQAFGSPSYYTAAEYGARRYLGFAESHSVTADWDFVNISGLFLLGLWTGREGIPNDVSAHRAWLWKVAAIALPVGLALSIANVALSPDTPLTTLTLAGRTILAVGYLASGALLLEASAGRRISAVLAPAGRMALTNYLAYGLIGQILFYGWAFDLIGKVGAAEVLFASIVTYGLMLLASHLWFRYFRYGPVEWLWRSVTRRSFQPLRKMASS